MNKWTKAQEWERQWHGNCLNTFGEEYKQLVYAEKMGLKPFHNGKSPYNFDMGGKKVIDIGGGPNSLLLKCVNMTGTVIDPLPFPDWVYARYQTAGIRVLPTQAEYLDETGFDLALIYNVLQHTESPECVIHCAMLASKEVRIFEWIDTGTNVGHLHNLTANKLDKWLAGEGRVEHINKNTACGKAYFGIFKGVHFGKP